MPEPIQAVIPAEIDQEYNHALTQMAPGKNVLIGYEKERKDLASILYSPDPIAMLLARAGSGKTELVRQFIYDHQQSDEPAVIIQVNLEKLGELGSDLVVSRMRTLLSSAAKIRTATQDAYPNRNFKMVLFIDEIHKLNNYGAANLGSEGSSGAMNALKEETSEGLFPLLAATTTYEYKNNIKRDPAFARRFSTVKIEPPSLAEMVEIVQRRLKSLREKGKFTPMITDENAQDLVTYTNSYVFDQANPAKAISMLNKCIGFCAYDHAKDYTTGLEITHETIRQAFLSIHVDIDAQGDGVHLVIPPELNKKYNGALVQLPMGDNSMIGYEAQRRMLNAAMMNVKQPSALLLGDAGIGKTALIEQWIYDRNQTDNRVAVVSLEIEKLGELDENVVIARMRDLLSDLQIIRKATQDGNPHTKFKMVLFIDEIHKLNSYGATNAKEGSSAAMNALKEGTARGKFPIIGATTDYEYRANIVADEAFDRRFGKVVMEQPTLEQVIKILRRQLEIDSKIIGEHIEGSDDALREITNYADAFIRNQANPAKSLVILDKCTGFLRSDHILHPEKPMVIDHEIIRQAFEAEGYAIDATASPKHIEEVVRSGVIGQPLALKQLTSVVRTSLYARRNYKKPLMTAFFVGTTGSGKTETAKLLAKAFYGRSDAMVMINCGDYATKESAIDAQHYIGDHVQINKQQLILLDEIEKADIAVMDAFMRMIDDGIARDSHNIDRSLNSTVIIATSNLGAKQMSQMSYNLRLDAQPDPNAYDPRLDEAWQRQEQTIRTNLQEGDPGRNNGIKPEFLERFSLFVPYLPLSKKSIALIARMQLDHFIYQMEHEGRYPIKIVMPARLSHAEWQRLISSKTEYGDDDPISVMIADDVIGTDSSANGARSISRFIDQRVKVAVVDALDYRVTHNLPIDGAFKLSAENASFQSNDRKLAHVKVTYVPKEQL